FGRRIVGVNAAPRRKGSKSEGRTAAIRRLRPQRLRLVLLPPDFAGPAATALAYDSGPSRSHPASTCRKSPGGKSSCLESEQTSAAGATHRHRLCVDRLVSDRSP